MILNVLSLSGIYIAYIYGMSIFARSIHKNGIKVPHLIAFGIGMVMSLIKVILKWKNN